MSHTNIPQALHNDWLRTPAFRLIFILAWLTFAAGYTAVHLLTRQGAALDAANAALQVVLPATLLSFGVIWVCRRLPVPDRQHLWIIPMHGLLAFVYSVVWIFTVLGILRGHKK